MLKKSSETERKIKTRIFKRRERRVKIIPNKRLEQVYLNIEKFKNKNFHNLHNTLNLILVKSYLDCLMHNSVNSNQNTQTSCLFDFFFSSFVFAFIQFASVRDNLICVAFLCMYIL